MAYIPGHILCSKDKAQTFSLLPDVYKISLLFFPMKDLNVSV